MQTLIIHSDSPEKLRLLQELAQQLGAETEIEQTLLEQIKQGLTEVKLMQEGKIPQKTLKDLLNGK
jgi:hypothetical protein